MQPNPLNFQAWIDEHRHLLKPPVGNKVIYDGDFIVMVVGGPNARTDYHWDEGPEWFYQLEGEMVLRIQEAGAVRDIPIRAGEIFLLPPRVPHSPQRMPGSVGLVVEGTRAPGMRDGFEWFCFACGGLVHEAPARLRVAGEDHRQTLIEVGLDHVHAALDAGVHIVIADLYAVAGAAARLLQMREQGAIAAAQVQHMAAFGDHLRDPLVQGQIAHEPSPMLRQMLSK